MCPELQTLVLSGQRPTLVGSTQVEGTPGTECSLEIQQVSGGQVSLAGIPKVNSKLFGFVGYWFI